VSARPAVEIPPLELVVDPPLLALVLLELLDPHAASATTQATVTADASVSRNRRMYLPPLLFATHSSGAPHERPAFGLSASCRPSPTRLNASTVSTRATPGKTMYHQAVSKTPLADAIICPQLAVGGWIPTPRNERAASYRMFVGRI